MKEIKVKLTFTEELLGTASNNPDIHGEYIAPPVRRRSPRSASMRPSRRA